MTERQQITIKAKCKGVIRLLKIPKDVSYDAFHDLLKNSFGISNCHLQYSDEEGDKVELGSQEELHEALKVEEKLSSLKITLVTNENPTMSAMINKPSDSVPPNTMPEELPVDNVNLEQNLGNGLVQPLSDMTINEKPTPKPRPNRKRIGFYTSLCSDISDVEKGKFASSEAGKHSKPKKEKRVRGSKYYTSLADEIATMKLQQEEEEMKRNAESRANDKAARKSTRTRSVVEKVEKDSDEASLSDEEPPKWFNKVVTKMSQSVSSHVLGALNCGVMVPASPTKPKRDGAAYVHHGITCDGCQQVIVGSRYKCGNCPDFDLCEPCEAIEDMHDPSHVFVKLRFPGVGIGRRHGVMIPLLKDIIYKSKDVELAEAQDKRMKEVRKKLKQLSKKKREEQVGKKKADKKMRKLQKAGGSNSNENHVMGGYELALLGDESYPDGTEVTPGFEFTKSWKIRNTGTLAWNDSTKLVYLYGGMRCLRSTEVGLPHLEPGQEGTVMITFVAPLDIGEYYSVWRASNNERNFGSKIWCKIKVVGEIVPSDNEDEIFVDADVATIEPMQESFHESMEPNIFDQDSSPTTAEQDPIFHAYETQQSQDDETVAVDVNSSETQATASDVSLLECNELEWDTCIIDQNTHLNEDDAPDIEVLSIASSDDFCVVPLPACFDPDIPLNFEDLGQGVSLAQEMNIFGSHADQQDTTVGEEPETLEATAELLQNEYVDPEDDHDSSGENTIPDRPVSPDVDRPVTPEVDRPVTPEVDRPVSPERELHEPTTSVPINIEVKTTERGDWHPLMMADFDARSTISEPVAPQPPSLERNPLFSGRLPASPPGRAVPIVQISVGKPGAQRTDSASGSYEVEVVSDQGQWQTVRTQPPEVIAARQISEDETVTIQPRGAAGMTAQSSSQSTAQFAQTFVTGTLKRAIGTVTDTVTSFMTGNNSPTAVVYSPAGSSDDVVNVQVNVPVVQQRDSSTDDTRSLMKQLSEMGFCDRQLNGRLLKKHNMDVSKVVTELLHENDNNWSAERH